jgi:dihydropteroate synthase
VSSHQTSSTPSSVYVFGKRSYDLSSRSFVMGVVNVTPDSFSDAGRFFSVEAAVDHARRMIDQGADFIDVGGESTRPKGKAYGEGSDPVDAREELRRVLPVIERLAGSTDIPLSIDTYKSEVAREALNSGARIVNDISGFHYDPDMPSVVAEAGASAVVMHIRGTPKTMQQNPVYGDLLGEIREYLRAGLAKGEKVGIRQMIVDPGIGFGKTLSHNLRLLASLSAFGDLGYPVLVGPSRKAFIGEVLELPVEDRLEGTIAAVVFSVLNGANIVRVHDVKETVRAVRMADALKKAAV